MAFSDSMFLFELVVEELRSYIKSKKFIIKSQFADIFTLNLRDPNELQAMLPRKKIGKRSKRKLKIRRINDGLFKKHQSCTTVQSGQSILIVNNLDLLTGRMKQYPIELSLWSKVNPENKIGSTHIRWDQEFIHYLNKIYNEQSPLPVSVTRQYSVFDEHTSKRMASIKLYIKLTYLKDKITTQFRSLSEQSPETFMYTGFNSKPTTILSTIKETTENVFENPGIIKTIYSGGRNKVRKVSKDKNRNVNNEDEKLTDGDEFVSKDVQRFVSETQINEKVVDVLDNYNHGSLRAMCKVKSDTNMNNGKQITLMKSKSCSLISTLKSYIFGNYSGPYRKQVYCVGYCTVENIKSNSPNRSKTSVKPDSDTGSKSDEELKAKYKIELCDSKCASKKSNDACAQSVCSVDLPEEAANITVTKCSHVECNAKTHRKLPSPPDDRILLDITNLEKECCVKKVEEVVGGMTAKMKLGDDPCFCACECVFGFTKKTTYCDICGGYEIPGEELARKPTYEIPTPCPIFHKLVDKSKLKTWSTSGSESKKYDTTQRSKPSKSMASDKRSDKKSVEPDKETKKESIKGKKKKKDDRFKFNYGYTGIPPHIGHSECILPCVDTPSDMGWLWTAKDVPGLKFRPMWKPGAVNKHTLRKLNMAKNPGEVYSRKRKKDTGPKKRPLKRPLLVVHKKDGEYTVTLERMKSYPKPRTINQHPYEDKPLLTYTIGRTDEENFERKKKKERQQRRLEREQRQFIQSAFKDMCHDICLKTYQQALGIVPNAEDPQCQCFSARPESDKGNTDVSCSCSEDKSLLDSDTDSDEWIIEITPPIATFDPKYKPSNIQKIDNSSQYTYLDYRVKLLDRFGNPVPRFFTGPDGKQQCSDLGGFWSPEHKWLEINVDGFIAPDGRWAPNSFIGPNGEQVDAEDGKFQIGNEKWLVLGVDGFIDCQGKWRYYAKPRTFSSQKKISISGTKKSGAGDKQDKKAITYKSSETTWSCFGDVSPKELSKLGITGHGQDKKRLMRTLKDMKARGENVRLPQTAGGLGASTSKKSKKQRMASPDMHNSGTYFEERRKCRHPVPSQKGIVAVDDLGNKTYFRMKNYKNNRIKQRLKGLKEQGISLSSFHVPCFHSFISSEIMKQQLRKRLLANNPSDGNNVAPQF